VRGARDETRILTAAPGRFSALNKKDGRGELLIQWPRRCGISMLASRASPRPSRFWIANLHRRFENAGIPEEAGTKRPILALVWVAAADRQIPVRNDEFRRAAQRFRTGRQGAWPAPFFRQHDLNLSEPWGAVLLPCRGGGSFGVCAGIDVHPRPRAPRGGRKRSDRGSASAFERADRGGWRQ